MNYIKSYEKYKIPDKFTFKPNKNKIKSNISKKDLKILVKKAKNYIKKGDIFQVVLSQRFERKINKRPIRNLQLFKKAQIHLLLCFILILKILMFWVVVQKY